MFQLRDAEGKRGTKNPDHWTNQINCFGESKSGLLDLKSRIINFKSHQEN